jgi:hypothetical protein
VPVPVDPNVAEGTVRLNTFLPGSYEVRLYDRREGGIAVASLPVCIADRDAEISACPDIAGHWLLQWSYGGPSLRGEIAVANQGGIDETYDYYAPSLEEDLNGPAWTCQRFGRTLACKVRFDPDSRCPNQGPHLANIEMTVDPSGQRLDGDYVITVSNDTSACAWVPLETAMQFSFEMVRDPAYQ